MTTEPDPPITVINLISVAFSGSTWLNLLLGSHPRAFSVGEMKRLRREDEPICTIHGKDCPVWSSFDRASDANPFRQLAAITQRDVFIVNNSRKFLPAQREPGIRPRFVHLVRDGRAVAASMVRKGQHPTVASAARALKHELRRNERLIRRQPAADVIRLRYEDALVDPAGRVERLCAWAGLDYRPAMLRFWQREHHFLGGNQGTLFAMLRKAGDSAEAMADRANTGLNWQLAHYREADPARFRDERWKRELDDQQLRRFGRILGRWNRRYGYPPARNRE